MSTPEKLRGKVFGIVRDVVLFVLGVFGIIHETILAGEERPFLLVLFAAMVGLTGVIRGVELDVRKDKE